MMFLHSPKQALDGYVALQKSAKAQASAYKILSLNAKLTKCSMKSLNAAYSPKLTKMKIVSDSIASLSPPRIASSNMGHIVPSILVGRLLFDFPPHCANHKLSAPPAYLRALHKRMKIKMLSKNLRQTLQLSLPILIGSRNFGEKLLGIIELQ
jgi:hypothetical protein